MSTINKDKYYSDLNDICAKYGAFWAFGDKQFNEQKKDGVKYYHLLDGLLCPKENADSLLEDMRKLDKKED